MGGSRIKCFDSQSQSRFEGEGVVHSDNLAIDLANAIVRILPSSITSCTRVFMSLAAIPQRDHDRHLLAAALYQRLSFDELIICTDTHAASLSSSTPAELTVAIGTGITARIKTKTESFDMSGHGYLIGDEGSAHWIGRQGLNLALRSAEGRDPQTSLTELAARKFGVPLKDLADHIHQMPNAVSEIAGFAKVVSAAAENNDLPALQIIQQAANEISGLIHDAISRASIETIALVGGVVSGSSLLKRLLISEIEKLNLILIEEAVAPLDGLLKLATSKNFHSDLFIVQTSKIPATVWSALYLEKTVAVLDEISQSQMTAIVAASEILSDSLANGGLIHTFGTGHSHLLAEEIFYRAGGLAAIYPVLDERLMLHKEVVTASQAERLPNLASELIQSHPIADGDVVIVISNSGGNQVIIDFVTESKNCGAKVIALTSLRHATSSSARSNSSEKIHQLADLVLDNCGEVGDASIRIPGATAPLGPTSTIGGSAILHAIVIGAVTNLVREGVAHEIFLSSNLKGGDENNQAIFDKFSSVIHLYN